MIIRKKSNRVQRVAQEIKRKIAIILQKNLNDPRVGMLTILEVYLSKDLKNAKVFVTFLDKENIEDINIAINILQRASRFIRFLLAESINLRIVPMLLFIYDASMEKGRKICSLLKKYAITN